MTDRARPLHALVTGAASGIGLGIAACLAAREAAGLRDRGLVATSLALDVTGRIAVDGGWTAQ